MRHSGFPRRAASKKMNVLEVDELILVLIIDVEHVLHIISRSMCRLAHDLGVFVFELLQCQFAIGTILVEISKIRKHIDTHRD